ncbi:MAG TPA: methyltransferase domain-containing protein [bacterium]|nr:methyltransferase domain-containing protein [bacterium]
MDRQPSTRASQSSTANRQRKTHWTDDFFEAQFGRVLATRSPEITQRQVDFIIEKTGIHPGASVLDVCCGYGRHSIELARRGYEVVGIDRFGNYLNEARRQAASENAGVEAM